MKKGSTKKKTLSQKINRSVKIINFVSTLVVAGVTVYSMIPKNEKISGIDTDALINNI